MAATDADKAAQQARSKQYHIAIKDGGSVTKPGEWKDVPDSQWGDPVNYSYPMPDKSHADNAASRWGDASNRSQYSGAEQKIIGDRIAARQHHFGEKPDDSKESTPSESISISSAAATSSSRPRARIASVQVCWIEDNARSLNGRVYPAESVSQLIASGQRKLSDSSALPLTCFLSHEAADGDQTRDLIGKITRVWREGTKGMALIDLADTTVARDALALIAGGYLQTESLRAKNAELRTDPRFDVPLVTGKNLELEGIDLTNYPGLESVARIQQVHLAESANGSAIHEVFALAPTALEIHQPATSQKGLSMSKLTEDTGNTVNGYQPTSGEAPYMTNDPTRDSYGQRMYKAPDMTNGPMQGMTGANNLDVQEAHDRIAMVQNRACAPMQESARWKKAFAGLSLLEQAEITLREAGRALSKKNDAHLDKAHDALARVAGMACEGANNKNATATDPDGDGDDDTTNDPVKNPDWAQDQMESTRQGRSPMTEEEALKLLEARGYGVQRPKTEAELLREQLVAVQAEQKQAEEKRLKEMDELRAMIAQQHGEPAPTRKSHVLGASVAPASSQNRPLHGRYLQEKIRTLDWDQLADRTAPLPTDVPMDLLMREFEHLYALMYDDRSERLYGISPMYTNR